jgi:hypothetical protein
VTKSQLQAQESFTTLGTGVIEIKLKVSLQVRQKQCDFAIQCGLKFKF